MKKAVAEGVLSDENPLVMLYNLDQFKGQLESAKKAFSPNFLHTVAVKANPVLVCEDKERED